MRTYNGPIKQLREDEVFVFGANVSGFHGAGAAGYASFGVPGNRWREFDYGSKPAGWLGKWNVKGRVGLMEGREGRSYGLVTVERPGARRSLVPDFRPLYACCLEHPEWTFYLAQEGRTGLNGWSPVEMAGFMHDAGPIPPNLILSSNFAPFLKL